MLIEADRFLGQIFNMLRLCCDRKFDEPNAPPGLKKLLVESVKEKDFETLKARLIQVEQSVFGHYIALLQLKGNSGESSMTAHRRQEKIPLNSPWATRRPDFAVAFDSAQEVTTESLKGKNKVLYFYPKDDTPGCTIEAKDFRDHMKAFAQANAVIIGVSKDSLKSHDAFKKKYCLPFPLASDETGKMCEDYGVWVEKSMYGKTYMGIERTTLLIGKGGVIRAIWRKVKVEGHVKEVLEAVKAL